MRIITCTSLSSATSTPRDNRQYALSRMSRSLVSGLLHAPTCANVPGRTSPLWKCRSARFDVVCVIAHIT